ncbi:unnamed protein product [Miscanthus lutarioriparius]|uniref:Uncharacterized protein n=1 Tax=Miscanthus lutarioriparius TaxID=422564 RepID=A0A811SAX8_9POAL|nr:unnamed protein product [Miscanthus lutarioriparius]
MALEAETVSRRPFLAAGGGDGELSAGTTVPVLLATEKDRPVDEVIWGNEKRMKRELLAWAKAVASMATSSGKNTTSSSPSSPWLSMTRTAEDSLSFFIPWIGL